MENFLTHHQNQLTKTCFLLILFSSLLRRVYLPHSNTGIHYFLLLISAVSLILLNSKYIVALIKKQKAVFMSVGIFYLWMWLCAIFSPFQSTAITYNIKYSVYFIILLAFLLLTYINKNLFFYYRCILFLLQIVAILGFIEVFFPNLVIFQLLRFPSFYPQIGSIMQNPNQFGVIMVIGLCITLILGKQKSISQVELYTNEFIFIMALALSASRNSWMVFIIGMLLLWLYRIISIRESIFIISLWLFCVLLSPVSTYRLGLGNSTILPISNPFTNLSTLKIDNPSSTAFSRLKIWQSSINEVIKRPFTGIGMGTFAEHIKVFGTEGIHTHNIFLNVLTELGIPGVLIFIDFLRRLTHKLKFDHPIAIIPITLFLASQMVDFFIEDYTFTTIELFFLTVAINSKHHLSQNVVPIP